MNDQIRQLAETLKKTGIAASAYTGGNPWDDFYLSDFASRIHINDNFGQSSATYAAINEEARYGDGKYHLYVKATTVTGVNHISSQFTPTEIILDNFRPHIKRVEIKVGSSLGAPVYNGLWNWNGTNLILSQNTLSFPSTTDNLWVKIYSSEPMTSVSLTIASVISTTSFTPVASSNNMQWEFNIPATTITGTHTLSINGQDYAGNPLELNPNNIPIRQSPTVWTPPPSPGADTYHYFEISNNLIADFSANSTTVIAGGSLIFTDFSTGNPTSWTWNFQGSPTSSILQVSMVRAP